MVGVLVALSSGTAMAQQPFMFVDDASVFEGNGGTKAMTFTVSLDHPSSQNVTFRVQTVDGTGPGGATAPGDYQAISSSPAQITAGATSVAIDVPIQGDLTHEATETFSLVLAAEAKATVAKRIGAGTITDNDPGPDVSVADTDVAEGTLTGPSLTFISTESPAPDLPW